jgi:hypothetical protein
VKHEHTSCYRNPILIPVAILIFIGSLALLIFSLLAYAVMFAFYFAWIFMLKDSSSVKENWNLMCDRMKWSKDD